MREKNTPMKYVKTTAPTPINAMQAKNTTVTFDLLGVTKKKASTTIDVSTPTRRRIT